MSALPSEEPAAPAEAVPLATGAMRPVALSPEEPVRPSELIRFLRGQLSAGAATFVDWALLSLTIALGAHYAIAVAVGAVAGAATDFSIKRGWVFGAAQGALPRQMWRYLLVSGASLAWNELLTFVAVDLLHAPAIPGAICASVIVGAAWNYPMHRAFVFRRA